MEGLARRNRLGQLAGDRELTAVARSTVGEMVEMAENIAVKQCNVTFHFTTQSRCSTNRKHRLQTLSLSVLLSTRTAVLKHDIVLIRCQNVLHVSFSCEQGEQLPLLVGSRSILLFLGHPTPRLYEQGEQLPLLVDSRCSRRGFSPRLVHPTPRLCKQGEQLPLLVDSRSSRRGRPTPSS